MPAKRPQVKWLRLPVALAWVLTRDYGFTYQVKVAKTLEHALALYNHRTDEKVGTVVENKSIAWLRLREAIANRSIRARGLPYDKHLLDRWRAHARISKEGRPFFSEYQKNVAIPTSEVSALVVETGDRMQLRPETFVFSGGRWWRDVIVCKDDLIRIFPVTQPMPAVTPGRAHHRALTRQALIELYGPNGPAGVAEKQRLDAINTWFYEKARNEAKNPGDVKLRSDFVSRATIRRAMKEIRSSSQRS